MNDEIDLLIDNYFNDTKGYKKSVKDKIDPLDNSESLSNSHDPIDSEIYSDSEIDLDSESESESDVDPDSDAGSDYESHQDNTNKQTKINKSNKSNKSNKYVKMTKKDADRIYSKPIQNNDNNYNDNNNDDNNDNNDNNDNDDNIVLGIDLGTSNTCCAIWRNGNIEIIPDEFGNRTIPSIVAFTKKSRYIGLDAKNQTELNPKNVITEVKRLIGKKINDKSVCDDKEFLTYDIVGANHINNINDMNNINNMSNINNSEIDNILIKTEIDKTFTPEEISGMILSKIKTMASEYIKKDITKAVITIPHNFNDAQRQATKDAATIAGLECLRIIHEPTAAALAYGLQNRSLSKHNTKKCKKSEMNVIVYDFGGGTLDVSLLNITEGIFEVLGAAGISHLGGADFDKKIMKYCLAYFKKVNKVDSYKELSTLSLQKLKRQCENAKKMLSTTVRTTIAIKDFHQENDLYITLTQDKLIELCRDLLIISIEPLDDLLKTTGMSTEDIDEIIMVGGMTRMPIIRENIKRYFGKEPNCTVNPDEVVAMGAAIQGYILSHDDDPFSESVRLLDVLPLSLGIETIGGVMNTLIRRNTIIPFSKKRLYTTDSDYETSVLIKIFEGERKMTKDNFFVGDFELNGIESMPRGVAEIEVKFNVDANGIITVTAEDTETRNKNSITITGNKGRLTKKQIEKMIMESREYELKDKVEKVKKQFYYEIDDLCSNIKYNISNDTYKLSSDDKNSIQEEIGNIEKWLKEKIYTEREDDEYKHIIDKIKRKYGTLILKANIDNEDSIKANTNNDKNTATNVYGDDEDEEFIKQTFDKIENDELGLDKIPDADKNEIKELRSCLTDLCNNLFDILTSNNLKLDLDDKYELRDYIDDTLLWMHVHMKAAKTEYKTKIDMINTKCDEIMNKYNNDDPIFGGETEDENKTAYEELEHLCYLLKSVITCEILTIEQNKINELDAKIEETLNWLYDEQNQNNNNKNLHKTYRDKIDEINNLCNKLHFEFIQKNDGIHLSTNILPDSNGSNNDNTNCVLHTQSNNFSKINELLDNLEDDLGGVSIADLIKKRTNQL